MLHRRKKDCQAVGFGCIARHNFRAALLTLAMGTAVALALKSAGRSVDAAPRHKLIALTFDDGPRPWVLRGNSAAGHASASLLDLLDRQGAKATFLPWRGGSLPPPTRTAGRST
jgi:hypothetical protein